MRTVSEFVNRLAASSQRSTLPFFTAEEADAERFMRYKTKGSKSFPMQKYSEQVLSCALKTDKNVTGASTSAKS